MGAEWAGDPKGALTSIDTLDGSLLDICVDVHSLATTGVLSSSMLNASAPGLRIRVCNTRWSNHSGTHWFTIVYHMQALSGAAPRLNHDDCMSFVRRAVEDCIARHSHSTREIQFDEITATTSRLLVAGGYIELTVTDCVEVSEHLASLCRLNVFPDWRLDSGTFNIHNSGGGIVDASSEEEDFLEDAKRRRKAADAVVTAEAAAVEAAAVKAAAVKAAAAEAAAANAAAAEAAAAADATYDPYDDAELMAKGIAELRQLLDVEGISRTGMTTKRAITDALINRGLGHLRKKPTRINIEEATDAEVLESAEVG